MFVCVIAFLTSKQMQKVKSTDSNLAIHSVNQCKFNYVTDVMHITIDVKVNK